MNKIMVSILPRAAALATTITVGLAAGCASNVMNDFCAGGAANATGGRSSTICDVGSGGSANDCPQLEARYAACEATQLRSDVKTINVLFVVDKSASMNQLMPSVSGQTKWETTRAALVSLITSIDGTSEDTRAEVNFGLELFPYDPSSFDSLDGQDPAVMCQVPSGDSAVAVKIDSFASGLRAISDALNAQIPSGLVPTAEALRQAYSYFTVGEGQCLRGSKWVLLVTNGDANCNTGITCDSESCTQNLTGNCTTGGNCCDGSSYLCQDDSAVTAAISQLANADIQTFVAGMPGSSAETASLNAYANAGKMPNVNGNNDELFYSIGDATGLWDLEDAFGFVLPDILRSCDFQLKQSPTDPTSGHVYVDCLEIPPVGNDGGTNGWQLDYSYVPAHLILSGDACSMIVTTGAKSMDVFFDCPN